LALRKPHLQTPDKARAISVSSLCNTVFKVRSHVLRIAFKGYETSMAINYGETKGTVREIREEQSGIVAISYVDSEDRVFEHRIMPARV
jgi:hypothetical protein